MSNPGPATTVETYGQSLTTQQAKRSLFTVYGLNLSAVADTQVNILGFGTNFCITDVVVSNSAGTTANVAAGAIALYSAPNAGGTALLAATTLTGLTTNALVFNSTVSAPWAEVFNTPQAYLRVTTAVSGGLVDVHVYGYDLS